MPTPPDDSQNLISHLDYLSLLSNALPPSRKAAGVSRAPLSEQQTWRLDYIIGTGAYGTVFLENVHLRGMKSPELWAVKRIPQTLPNFTFKRYQAEIRNLEALSRVSIQDSHHLIADIRLVFFPTSGLVSHADSTNGSLNSILPMQTLTTCTSLWSISQWGICRRASGIVIGGTKVIRGL